MTASLLRPLKRLYQIPAERYSICIQVKTAGLMEAPTFIRWKMTSGVISLIVIKVIYRHHQHNLSTHSRFDNARAKSLILVAFL